MGWNQSYYDLLIFKLDQFTRKFYLNKLLRGSIYFIGMLTLAFILVALLEHQFYFSKITRKILFYSFLGLTGFAFFSWIVSPLLHYMRLGKMISHEEASRIIGTHFKDVKDKLLNVLQLKSQSINFSDKSLIEASINQKASELKPIPFVAAIDLNKNRKYLRYALIPVSLLMGIIFLAPSLIKDSTTRLIQNNKDFAKAAPFSFGLINQKLEAIQNEDFNLEVLVSGNFLPSEAYIEYDNFQYRLRPGEDPGTYTYTFGNVQKDTKFRIYSGEIKSEEFTLEVILKPVISDFEVRLEYPSYTGRKNESFKNTGGLIVPVGTKVSWNINTENTDLLEYRLSESNQKSEGSRRSENEFQFSTRIMKDQSYTLYLNNNKLSKPDTIQYQITAIADQYPLINAESFEDSTQAGIVYFGGELSDDYGLKDLTFNYQIKNKSGKTLPEKSVKVNLTNGKASTFRHVLDMEALGLLPGDHISYYFEVWDNDGVNGSKSTRSTIMEHHLASQEELAQKEEANSEDIKKNLEEAVKEAQKLQDKLNEYRNKLRQKKDLEWQNKKDFEKLIKQQEDIQQKFEKAQKKFEENLKKQEQHSNPDEKLQEKQQQLQQHFNESMNKEMQQLMNQIQQLMQELQKDQAIQMTEQFQNKSEDMKKEMDRLLELFKQLELEKNIKDQIDKLRELANEQMELKEKTEKKSEDAADLKKQQEEINKKFEDLKKKQDEIQKKNQELEQPKKIEDQKKNAEEAKKSLENAKDKLEKKQNDGASKDQKEGVDKMNEMADQMESQMEQNEKEQQEEDIRVLRQLLENLVGLSFEQELLSKTFEQTQVQSPKYVTLVQEQFKLKTNFKLIQDTLEALSKRVVEIESFVGEKVSEINENFGKTIEKLEDRQIQMANTHQGKIMKNVNDLAVMLSETMNNKQKEQNSSCNKPGSKSCKKPGKSKSPKGKKGKVPMDKIVEGQQKVGEEMKKLGEKNKKGEGKLSKEFAEMAAEQAKLRKMLEDFEKEKKEQGLGSQEMKEAIEQMNKTEKELVNKQLTNETLKRQQEITTRLLEAERAEREREYKEERKSETGTKIERSFPAGLEEYLKQRQAETEWFQHVSPDLRPFYKKLVEEYFNRTKKQG